MLILISFITDYSLLRSNHNELRQICLDFQFDKNDLFVVVNIHGNLKWVSLKEYFGLCAYWIIELFAFQLTLLSIGFTTIVKFY